MLIYIISKGSNSTTYPTGLLYRISCVVKNILSAIYVDWGPPHLSLVVCLYITPTYTSSMQDLILQEMQQKLPKILFSCNKNTWHVESSYILQHPKHLLLILNRFRYTNNSITKDRCSIPMDTTVMLGPLKFSLRATIDHHGPSIHSGHYTASINCCKNILLQRQQNYGV